MAAIKTRLVSIQYYTSITLHRQTIQTMSILFRLAACTPRSGFRQL